jgi:hypothetical protein
MNNGISWYRQVLRMNKDKISKNILKIKLQGKNLPHRKPRSRWKQQIRA